MLEMAKARNGSIGRKALKLRAIRQEHEITSSFADLVESRLQDGQLQFVGKKVEKSVVI